MNDDKTTIATLTAQLAEARAELDLMKTAGIIEVSIRNPSVADYMQHWEGRVTKAEAERDAALAGAVTVKGLEWRESTEDGMNCWLAKSLGVTYEAGVYADGSAYWCFHRRVDQPSVDIDGGEAEAKLAAQSDHDARIRAQIVADTGRMAKVRKLVEAARRMLREAELDGMEQRAGWDCWMGYVREALRDMEGA